MQKEIKSNDAKIIKSEGKNWFQKAQNGFRNYKSRLHLTILIDAFCLTLKYLPLYNSGQRYGWTKIQVHPQVFGTTYKARLRKINAKAK